MQLGKAGEAYFVLPPDSAIPLARGNNTIAEKLTFSAKPPSDDNFTFISVENNTLFCAKRLQNANKKLKVAKLLKVSFCSLQKR